MADDNEPATKGDLQASLRDLEQRLDVKIGALENKMGAMENRLLREIGHALNVAVEQIGAKVSVLDENARFGPQASGATDGP